MNRQNDGHDKNQHNHTDDKTRVVILGAGFGGIWTAIYLDRIWKNKPEVEITLINRDNYFLMTPLLFEAGSGLIEPRHAVSPIRRLFKDSRFIEAEVEQVNFKRKLVWARHSPGRETYVIPYDHLVVALGGVTNRKLIPGSEYAITFKTLGDAIFLRNHVIDLFEVAEVEVSAQEKRELLTFIVIGGGLVGTELMGQLNEFTETLCRYYSRIRKEDISYYIFDASPRVLSEMEPEQSEYAARKLSERGVKIEPKTRVRSIEPNGVTLPDGRFIPSRTVLLAAGIAPNPVVAQMPLKKDAKSRIVTDNTMRVPDYPGVWALGDCASIPDPHGGTYSPLAQYALRQAKVLSQNITASIRGRELKPIEYESMGMLASLGRYTGLGKVKRLRIWGFFAWWLWRTYYLIQVPRFDRRIRIMLDWTIGLFFKQDVVKLDLFGEKHPSRAAAERLREAHERVEREFKREMEESTRR